MVNTISVLILLGTSFLCTHVEFLTYENVSELKRNELKIFPRILFLKLFSITTKRKKGKIYTNQK